MNENDPSVKEVTELISREPQQRWWFPMDKSVKRMLALGDIHIFINTDARPVICVTMFGKNFYEMLGRGIKRTIEPYYKSPLDEFIRQSRELEVQFEALQRDAKNRGFNTLTDEEKSVVTKGTHMVGVPQPEEKNVFGGGGLIARPGSAFQAAAMAAAATVGAAKQGAVTISDIKEEMQKKIKLMRDRAEQQQQFAEMEAKAKKVVQLVGLFGSGQPLDYGQLDLTLEFFSDSIVGSTISACMTQDIIDQLDDYIKTPGVKAREALDPVFKARVNKYKASRAALITAIRQRNRNRQGQNNNQTQPNNQRPNTPPNPPTPPPSSPPPGSPPTPPPGGTRAGPTHKPMPKAPQKQSGNTSPNQKFKQGLDDELESGLVEPEDKDKEHGNRRGKSDVKTNKGAVKPDTGKGKGK